MKAKLIDLPFPTIPGPERSPGLHLTDIISDLEKLLFAEKSIQKGGWGEPRLCMETGFIWERALSLAFREGMAHRIGEVELDGIVGSPDGWDIGHPLMPLEEYKCTWKSSRHPIDSHWMYMAQVKSYCKMVETCYCRMRVLHLMGDYKGSGPQYRSWWLEFTQRELDENWAMVTNHARSKGWID